MWWKGKAPDAMLFNTLESEIQRVEAATLPEMLSLQES
jgi:hypothetical protein